MVKKKASRGQLKPRLSAFGQRIDPQHRWEDIVLPANQLVRLKEICRQATERRKSPAGKSLTALFCGPPGAMKTLAAEVVARELALDLYRIDLSTVVSKYIGETEKNLRRVFDVAENANAILFFDEADALFGKRTEVKDAHDRYAGIEVNYMLQEMEQYGGIAILATNLCDLGEAFLRRMQVIVEFPRRK